MKKNSHVFVAPARLYGDASRLSTPNNCRRWLPATPCRLHF